MFQHGIAFDNPWYLTLLVLLPVLWWWSYRSLLVMGGVRCAIALSLRSLVLILLILALAELQWVKKSDRLTVVYLVDQSLSIREPQRTEIIDHVNLSIKRYRDQQRGDRVGVVVFGRDAAVEIPPFNYDVQMSPQVESPLDPRATDLAAAMKLSLALFPHDAAKRVVVVSDGNQNLGDALDQARTLVDKGVSIDVMPVITNLPSDIAVEKMIISAGVRHGEPFEVRIVLYNTGDVVVSGKLRILRSRDGREETRSEMDIEVPPGKKVFTMREEIEEPNFYTYEAHFVPEDPKVDAILQNNRATAFAYVRGRSRVLIVEDWENRGEFGDLIKLLRNENIEVTVQPSDRLFSSLAELQPYDAIILADVPKSSGNDAGRITHFSDRQVQMLVRSLEMGCGLIMIGGPNSFGTGGWINTELEKSMPVDFQIENAEVAPVGALVLIMHAGEMPQGNYWQKVVAREAILTLGPQDYCGLIYWGSSGDTWLGNRPQGLVRVGSNRQVMLAGLSRMTPGDMPQFDPAMRMASSAFRDLENASIKHMIILSDGDPSPPSPGTIQQLKNQSPSVQVTTVAIGTHGPPGSTPLKRIAKQTDGKYYVVQNAKELPRIYQREARRVARPLVYKDAGGLVLEVKMAHEMIKGISENIPPITGFVLTTVKDNPLVEVVLSSRKPADEKNNTILASWTYGLGKAVVLTTDLGARWAGSWKSWSGYEKLLSQVVRWSMRPQGQRGNFTVATDIHDGTARLVINALDKEDAYLNFLEMSGTAIGPNMQPMELKIHQTSPGRYLGEFDVDESGSYFIMVSPGPEQAPIRIAIDVPYSDEFRDRDTNLSLLQSMTELTPRGARPGQVIQNRSDQKGMKPTLEENPFRHDLPWATASQDIWPFLVWMAGCIFFCDVLVRRVHVQFLGLRLLVASMRKKLQRRGESLPSETMSRLQDRKVEVGQRLEKRNQGAHFEVDTEPPLDKPMLEAEAEPAAGVGRQPTPSQKSLSPDQEADSYTERLLKAKKKFWQKRGDREK